MSLFESATRVPLFIRAPGHPASVGAVTPVLSEMIDLYLTLADLAGLPDPRAEGETVNGTSLGPLFDDPHGGTIAFEGGVNAAVR